MYVCVCVERGGERGGSNHKNNNQILYLLVKLESSVSSHSQTIQTDTKPIAALLYSGQSRNHDQGIIIIH